jgi:hypothetical protein
VTARHVISSAPIRELANCLSPSMSKAGLAAADSLTYRDFLTVVLIAPDRGVFDDNWIYVHDPTVMVGRIQNFKSWPPEMVTDPKMASYGLKYFCFEGDGLWSSSDDELLARGRAEMDKLGLLRAADVVDGCVVRQPKAYPVYDDGYAERVEVVRREIQSRFPGLHMVGRNGMHKYNNQDHAMMTALLCVRNILAGEERCDLWAVNQEAEYIEAGARGAQSDSSGLRDVPKRVSAAAPRPAAPRCASLRGMSLAKVLVCPWLTAALASVALLFVSVTCLRTTFCGPSDVSLDDGSGPARAVHLPYSADLATNRPLTFVMHLRGGPLAPGSFVIVPDDHLISIDVNGRPRSLDGIDPAKLDDFASGFSYPLGRELVDGDNRVVVRVLNKGGKGGLDLRPDASRGVAAVELAGATLAALILVGAAMRRAGCRWSRAENYLWFDLRTFVTAAFTSAWDDDKGRQYFWNYLLKTSLSLASGASRSQGLGTSRWSCPSSAWSCSSPSWRACGCARGASCMASCRSGRLPSSWSAAWPWFA